MALIAWYPLNGDTKDYSGNNLNGINNGAKETNDGKIGKAYTFDKTNNIEIPISLSNLNSGSISLWYKPKSFYNFNTLWDVKTNADFWESWIYNTGRLAVRINPVNTLFYDKLSINKWYHISFTWQKNKKMRLYLNGIKKGERNINSWPNSGDSFFLGGSINTKGNGNMNDVRVYDHALSTKEIEEIAKAKILHYKFDDPYEEPTENLAYNNGKYTPVFSGLTTSVRNTVIIPNKKFRINTGEFIGSYNFGSIRLTFPLNVLKNNETYNVSFKFKIIGEGYLRCQDWADVAAKGYIEEKNGYSYYSYHGKRATYDNTYRFMDFNVSKNTEIEIWDIQLEEKSYATPFVKGNRSALFYDSSGYGDNISSSSNKFPEFSNESFLGKGSFLFDGKSNGLLESQNSNPSNELTLTAWVKPLGYGTSDRMIIVQKQSAFYLTINKAGYISTYWYGTNPQGYHSSSDIVPLNKWSHVSAVWDGNTITHYLNGVKSNSIQVKTPGATTNGYLYVGSESRNRYFDGYINNIKVYATALSQEDILELYQSRASLDNKGNFKISQINATTPKSAYEIKQRFPKAPSGLYLIKPREDENAFYAYCDMETEGGGWTLLVTATNDARTGWSNTSILERNKENPSLDEGYSILKYADDIKTNFNGELEYRLDAESLGRWGGVWRAPFSNTFTSKVVQRNAKNIKQWDNWTLNTSTTSSSSPSANVMPWISPNYPLTTYNGSSNWWGTIASTSGSYRPAPWITPQKQHPNTIWYWVR